MPQKRNLESETFQIRVRILRALYYLLIFNSSFEVFYIFPYRLLRSIYMSEKDEATRKRRNCVMKKMKEISEYNVYNRARTKTNTHVKCTNTQLLILKKNIFC